MKDYVDLLIPRGGRGLIQSVVNNATIPVIETGTGNCHVYVDQFADQEMAVNIIKNAKTQRIGVCNACESIVVHRAIAKEFLPKLYAALKEYDVEMRGDSYAVECLGPDQPLVKDATEEDWGTEYLDYIMSVKIVDSLDEAIAHINKYNTSHSEAIITKNYDVAQRFLNEIDSACVYVNASTRFPMEMNLVLAQRSESAHRNYMPEVRWGLRHLPVINILFMETVRYVHKRRAGK